MKAYLLIYLGVLFGIGSLLPAHADIGMAPDPIQTPQRIAPPVDPHSSPLYVPRSSKGYSSGQPTPAQSYPQPTYQNPAPEPVPDPDGEYETVTSDQMVEALERFRQFNQQFDTMFRDMFEQQDEWMQQFRHRSGGSVQGDPFSANDAFEQMWEAMQRNRGLAPSARSPQTPQPQTGNGATDPYPYSQQPQPQPQRQSRSHTSFFSFSNQQGGIERIEEKDKLIVRVPLPENGEADITTQVVRPDLMMVRVKLTQRQGNGTSFQFTSSSSRSHPVALAADHEPERMQVSSEEGFYVITIPRAGYKLPGEGDWAPPTDEQTSENETATEQNPAAESEKAPAEPSVEQEP